MRLWLDDNRTPPEGWTWAKTYKQAIAHLKSGEVVEISFDHDLGEGKTGYDVAKWIEEKVIQHNFRMPEWAVHSANPVGRKDIEAAMVNARNSWSSGVKILYRQNQGKWITLWKGDTKCPSGCLNVGWTRERAIRNLERVYADDKKSENGFGKGWKYRIVGDENEGNEG